MLSCCEKPIEFDNFEFDEQTYFVRLTEIEFDYWPGEKGSRDSLGVPTEPDWDEDFELLKAQGRVDCYVDEKHTIPAHNLMIGIVIEAVLAEKETEIIEHIKEIKNG
jgi:hypothetical protein